MARQEASVIHHGSLTTESQERVGNGLLGPLYASQLKTFMSHIGRSGSPHPPLAPGWFPFHSDTENQQVMAQGLKSLPPTWEIQMELLDSVT